MALTYDNLKKGFAEYDIRLTKDDESFKVEANGNTFTMKTLDEVIAFAKGFDLCMEKMIS